MLAVVNDYVTWGEVDDETLALLQEKRGNGGVFRLHPPRKGLGRKGIKAPFKRKGALGYRGTDINNLIRRMI